MPESDLEQFGVKQKDPDPTLWLSPLVLEKDFSVQFRGDHIHVVLGPDYKVEPDQQDEFWNKLKTAAEENNSRRALVEGYVPSGERQTGEVVDAGLRTAAVPDLWLAFCLEKFVPNERSELFQVIAASSGVHVKFFSDRDLALKWLRNNAPA
jgi:hypothetical protein